jgi:hypothetical protein
LPKQACERAGVRVSVRVRVRECVCECVSECEGVGGSEHAGEGGSVSERRSHASMGKRTANGELAAPCLYKQVPREQSCVSEHSVLQSPQ